MRRPIFILITLCVLLFCHTGWAQLSPKQEKRLQGLEEKEKALKIWEAEKPTQKKKLWELSEKEKAWKAGEAEKREFIKSLSKDNTGRFQAVRMNNSSVFILDTKEGHLWIWITQAGKDGRSEEFLVYQGQAVPGSRMGDLIDRTKKK